MTPTLLKAARKAAKHTQAQAAATVYASRRTWQYWESGEMPISQAHFELYMIKKERV